MSGVREIKPTKLGSTFELYQRYLQKDSSPSANQLDFFSRRHQPLEKMAPDLKKSFLTRAYAQEITPTNDPKTTLQQKRIEAEKHIDRYKKAITKEPGNATHYINLGRIYLDLNKPQQAEENFRKAIHIDEHNPDGYYYLAEVCYLKQDLEEALKNYNQALSLGKKSPRLFYVRGFLLEYYEKYDEALNNYDQALKLNPEYIDVYQARGNLREKLGQWDNAILDYQKILENDPHQTEVIYQLGSLLGSLARYQEALTVFSNGIQFNDNLDFLYLGRGSLKQLMGDQKGAVRDLEKAVELGTKDKFVYQNLAKLYEDLKQPEKSLEYYKKVIAVEYGEDVLVRNYQTQETPTKIKTIDDKIKEITIKINANKKDPSLYLARARLLEKKEDWKQVVQDYQKALALDPDNFDIRIQLGLSYLELDQIKKADQLVEEVLTQQPDHPKANYLKGKILAINEQWQEALKYLDLSIQKNPSFASPYIIRGEVLTQLNRVSEASRDFSAAIILDPNNQEAYKKRASLLYGTILDAIRDLEKAYQSNPDNIDITIELGKLYVQADQFGNALPYLEKAIQKVKPNWELYFLRAQCHEDLNDIDQAIQDYTQAIRLNRLEDEIYRRRADLFDQKGNYAKAYQDWNILYQRDPDNIFYRLNRARAAKLIGKLKEALSDFEFVLTKKPDYPAVYIWIGDIYFELGDYQKALSNYQEGIKQDPHHASYYFKIAQVYEKQLQFQEAIANYDLAIGLREDEPHYYLRRGRVYEELGQTDLATIDYKTSLELRGTTNNPTEKFEGLGPEDQKIYENLTKAIELQPHNANLYYQRSQLLTKKYTPWLNKERTQGSKDINTAININPFNEKYYLARSNISKYLPEPRERDSDLKDLKFLISINPEKLEYYIHLANSLFLRRQPQSALDEFDKYLEVKKDNPKFYARRVGYLDDILYRRINISNHQLKSKKLNDYRLALKYDPTNYSYRRNYLDEIVKVLPIGEALKKIDEFFKNKNDPEYFYYQYKVYEKAKDNKKALSSISKAIEKNPYHIGYYLSRAEFYYNTLKNYDLAEKDLDQATALNPSSIEAKMLKIKIYQHSLRHKKAIKEIKEILAIPHLTPSHINNYYFELIGFYTLLGDYKNVLKIYDDLIQNDYQNFSLLQEKYLESIFRKATFCYTVLGDKEQAIRELDRIINNKKIPLTSRFVLDFLFSGNGLYQRDDEVSFLFLNRWIAHSPNNPEIYFVRSELNVFKNPGRSIKDRHRILEIDPNQDSDFFYRLADLYERNKQLELAIESYKKAISLESKPNIKAYIKIFNLYVMNDQYQEGLAFFNTYHEKYPKDLEFFISKASLHRGFNREKLAIKDFSEGISLAKDNLTRSHFYSLRSLEYMKIGKYNEALSDIDHAIEIVDFKKKPSKADLYDQKASLFIKMGKLQEALEQYNHFLKIRPNEKKIIVKKQALEKSLSTGEPFVEESPNKKMESPKAPSTKELYLHFMDRSLYSSNYYHNTSASLLHQIKNNFNHLTYDELLEKIDQYLEKDPHHPWIYFTRAHIHFHFDQIDQGLSDLNEVQRLNHLENETPELKFSLDIVKLKVKALVSKNRFFEAIEEYNQLVNEYPESYEVVEAYIDFLKSYGKIRKAIEIIGHYLENNPRNMNAHLYQAQLWAEIDINQAIVQISNTIQQHPDRDCLLLRAELYMKKPSPEIKKAEDDFNKAIEIGKNLGEAGDIYIARAKFWWDLGQYSKAMEDLNRVIKSNSQFIFDAKKLKIQYAAMRYDVSEIKQSGFQ